MTNPNYELLNYYPVGFCNDRNYFYRRLSAACKSLPAISGTVNINTQFCLLSRMNNLGGQSDTFHLIARTLNDAN